MKRFLLVIVVLLTMGRATVPAQQTSNDANPLYRNYSIHLGGITVPPIAGAPFSATALIEFRQTMPDGSVATTHNVNLIGRDSRGRTHGEMRPWMPESFHGTPPLNEVHIFDPQTLVRTIYEPGTRVARLELMPGLPKVAGYSNAPNPLVKVDDLGLTTIGSIDVRGTRRTLTIPAQANGAGAPLTVVDEYWYSEDLDVNVVLRHDDPRMGLETIALTEIRREEPAAEFFEVPAGYKIVDMTPPVGAPAAGRPRR